MEDSSILLWAFILVLPQAGLTNISQLMLFKTMDSNVQRGIYCYTFSQGRIQYTQCNCMYEAFGETCHCYLGQVCCVCVCLTACFVWSRKSSTPAALTQAGCSPSHINQKWSRLLHRTKTQFTNKHKLISSSPPLTTLIWPRIHILMPEIILIYMFGK